MLCLNKIDVQNSNLNNYCFIQAIFNYIVGFGDDNLIIYCLSGQSSLPYIHYLHMRSPPE